jgi:hypothetical protein
LIDQVVIDPAAPLIELRIASTMGTSVPVNWVYRNGDGDTMQVKEDSGNYLFASIRAGSATAFSIDPEGLLRSDLHGAWGGGGELSLEVPQVRGVRG